MAHCGICHSLFKQDKVKVPIRIDWYVELEGGKYQFLVVQCKRPVSGDISEQDWEAAHDQLKNYVITSSASRPRFSRDLYGIVSIGREIRFYVMKRKSRSLDTLEPGTFDVNSSKNDIERILRTILKIPGDCICQGKEWQIYAVERDGYGKAAVEEDG